MDMPPPSSDKAVANLALRFGFATAIAAVFAALLAFAAADPQAMTRPVVGGVPLSLLLAAAMIVFAVALTGLYTLLVDGKKT